MEKNFTLYTNENYLNKIPIDYRKKKYQMSTFFPLVEIIMVKEKE